MSIQYQSLLGDSSIDADTIVTSELDATDANVSNLNATVTTTNTLKLPTSAALNNVLTCVNLNGTTAWRPPVEGILAGDCTGLSSANTVVKASGNFSVNNTISSASSSGLALSSTGTTYGPSKVTIQNIGGCNGMLLDTTGASVALTDIVCKTGTLSMNLRFEARGASLLNSANTTYGENQILLNNSLTAAAYFGTVSSGVTGYFNAPNGVWTGKITYPNVDVRKRMVLWEGGTWTDYNDHRFTGLGKISSAMLFSSVATSDDFVFSAATSATASNELFRIKGNGAVIIPGPLRLATGAGLARVLTSDGSGNATWMDPAIPTNVGNLTMSGYLYNPAGRFLLANNSSNSSLYLGEGGNNLVTGQFNVICGPSAYNMTTASYTTAIGTTALPALSTAFYTTAAGYQSLPTLTTGNSNTALGTDAGRGITTGANNTFLGEGTNATVGSISGSTCIGTGAFVTTSNTVQLGGSNVTGVNTYGTINAPSITTGDLSATAASVENLNARSYRAPTAQGTYLTWNREGGTGKACWGNQKGLGGGGHEWVDYDIGSSATTVLMSLDNSSNLTVGGIVLPSVGAILPKQVFNHYEEYLHTTAFLGPVITNSYNTRIVRTGKVVVLYIANNVAMATTTSGVLGWTMGSLIPTRFRPGSDVNCLLSGKQSNAPAIINCVVVSTGQVSLSVANGNTWSGNIGFYTFSITWTL